MKTPLRWASAHPVQAVLFSSAFTLLPAIMAVADALFHYALAAFVVLLVVMAVGMWRHRAVPVILVAACLVHQSRAADDPQPAVGVGAAVVVICIGGVCVYKVVKFCQRKFPPKSTNDNSSFSASGEYGGALEYSSMGSCYEPLSLLPGTWDDPTTFQLEVRVAGVVTTRMSASRGAEQTWQDFQADMAGHGLALTGRPAWQPQFERNGVPCNAAEVPLAFDPGGRVIHGSGARRIIIERSVNMETWTPLLVTDVDDGMTFRVEDTTREGQMFYRVTEDPLHPRGPE